MSKINFRIGRFCTVLGLGKPDFVLPGKYCTLGPLENRVSDMGKDNGMNRRVSLSLVLITLFAATAGAQDWPQYRGPTRDGIAPAGPKILDSWPTNGAGPKLVWKSEALWPDKGGKAGCSSVSIADGRAYTFAYVRQKTNAAVLTTQDLANWGWMDGVPDDLAKKVQDEKARGKCSKLKPGPELDAAAKEFAATLSPEEAKPFGPWVQRQLTDPNTRIVPWDSLRRLAPMRDKETTIQDLDGKAGIGASGWANPVRSFVTDKVFKLLDTIICLDAATGKEVWRKEFPGAPLHLTLDIGPSSTPTIADGKVYVQGSAGFYCLSAKDGAVVWQAKTRFSHSSPLVMNGVAYCLVPETTAFDAKTGQVLWSQPALKHTDTSVTKWACGGTNYLLIGFPGSCYDQPPGAIFCLNPADGKAVWSALCSSGELPVIAGADTLVIYNGGNLRAFRITPTNAVTLWEAKDVGGPRGSSPVVYQGYVYPAGACHSGDALSCYDLKTGEKKWNPRKYCAESSSPVLVDGKIITLSEEDELSQFMVMYRASPDKFEELGRFNPHAAPGASPTVVGGKMYLRLQDCVACYDLTAR